MRTATVIFAVFTALVVPTRSPGQELPPPRLAPTPAPPPIPATDPWLLALAQSFILPTPPVADDEGLTVRGSSVGYIDPAAPGNQVILRSDFGYDFRFPSRAEFFYAKARPGGPGLPFPEQSVDYQNLSLYAETLLGPRASVFVEGGVRFLNPVVNSNAAGFGDMNVGFKYAFLANECSLATFQFRTYVPSGDPHRGLGTSNVSLEPGLLGFTRLTDRLGLAGELRYWVPVGGTDFAGSVFRYGLGFRYDLWEAGQVRVIPVAEVVGWTVLDGRQPIFPPTGVAASESAAGTSIVNVKIGGRVDLTDRAGIYVGYGRAITGERWYTDVLRLDFRWLY